MNRRSCRAVWAASLVAAGCASRPPPPPAPVPPPAPPGPLPALAPPPPLQPVYRAPRIGRVLLRAHVDAQGRLLGPQVMYQIVDPGGWNLEALAAPAPAPPEPTEGIVATGRMRPEDRAEVQAEAARRGVGWTALFDPQAGWLLLPPEQKSR